MTRTTARRTLFPYTTLFRSYMTDNPAACANCHVMREQFEEWLKSSHGKVAVCNDCHTPPGVIAKDRKSTRLNSSHSQISYAVFCLKKKRIRAPRHLNWRSPH